MRRRTRRRGDRWSACALRRDGNGAIDRAELAELLAQARRGADGALTRVMKAAAAVAPGCAAGVTRAVMAYKGYLAEHAPLDRLFERLDADGPSRLRRPRACVAAQLAPDQPSAEGDADWVLLQLGTDSVDRDGFAS